MTNIRYAKEQTDMMIKKGEERSMRQPRLRRAKGEGGLGLEGSAEDAWNYTGCPKKWCIATIFTSGTVYMSQQ